MDDQKVFGSTQPLRSVDWRHQLAENLIAEQRYPGERQYGYFIYHLSIYLRRRQVIPVAQWGQKPYDNLHQAYQIRESNAPRLGAAIDALIIADEPVVNIAAMTGIPVAVIRWYEAAFFDVRSRLSATDFIQNVVIAGARRQHPADGTFYGWLLVGFLCGPNALRVVMGSKKEDTEQLSLALADRAKLILRAQLLNTAERMSPDSRMAFDLLRAEINRPQIIPNEMPLTQYEEIVAAFTKNLPFGVGELPADSPLQEFAGCAAELRTDDMMRVCAGLPLENAAEIKAKKFPPPRRVCSETDDLPREFPVE